jgi:hypothetical protein
LISRTNDTQIEHLTINHRPFTPGELYFALRPENCHVCPLKCRHGSTIVHFKLQDRDAAVSTVFAAYYQLLDISCTNSISLHSDPLVLKLLENTRQPKGTVSIFGNPSFELIRPVLRPIVSPRSLGLPCSLSNRTLFIEKSDFVEAERVGKSRNKIKTFADVLAETLRPPWRRSGPPIPRVRELKFTNCQKVFPEMLERLQQCARTVNWDGLGALEPGDEPTPVATIKVDCDTVVERGRYWEY